MALKFERTVAFQGAILPKGSRMAGLAALVHGLKLQAPVRGPSCVSEGHIRGSHRREDPWTLYDKRYWPGDLATDHIGFALGHEHIDLLVLKRAFDAIDPAVIEEFVRGAPTGALARRVWFFYETLIGKRLALEDAGTVRAVDALDNKVIAGAALDVFEHIPISEIKEIIDSFKNLNNKFDLIVSLPSENLLSRKLRKFVGKLEVPEEHITRY